jgi:hypothetical protein
MKIEDALKLLNLPQGNISKDDIKIAYRKAAFKYHPDRNPAGLEMMQMINAAYDLAQDFEGEFTTSPENFSDKINDALNAIFGCNLIIEICGCWVWVTGNTKAYKEILKSAGYKWSPKKMAWYFRLEENKRTWFNKSSTLDEIRVKYGSQSVDQRSRPSLTA